MGRTYEATIVDINKARCKLCGDVVESKYTHDFKFCKCGAIAVDGGHDYVRRVANDFDDIEELSVTHTETRESKF